MFTKICSLLGLIILLLTSCSDKAIETKDLNKNLDSGATTNTVKPKLTKVRYEYNSEDSYVSTFHYGTHGYITKLSFKKDGKNRAGLEIIFNYNQKNQIISTDWVNIDKDGVREKGSHMFFYHYNKQDFIVSSSFKKYGERENYTTKTEYTYNSKGQLETEKTSSKYGDSNPVYYYYDSKSNLIKSVGIEGYITKTYTYDDKNNPFSLLLPEKFAIIYARFPFPWDKNKNNIITEKESEQDEMVFRESIYEYEYNKYDYPIKKIEYDTREGKKIVSKTEFFYQ